MKRLLSGLCLILCSLALWADDSSKCREDSTTKCDSETSVQQSRVAQLASPEQVDNRLFIDSNMVTPLFPTDFAQGYFDWKARIKKDHGVNVYRTPDGVMKAQLKAWDVIVKKFNKSDPFFKKVIDSQMAWAKRHGAYSIQNAPDYKGAYEHYFGKL